MGALRNNKFCGLCSPLKALTMGKFLNDPERWMADQGGKENDSAGETKMYKESQMSCLLVFGRDCNSL